jgi:hypothetical protein
MNQTKYQQCQHLQSSVGKLPLKEVLFIVSLYYCHFLRNILNWDIFYCYPVIFNGNPELNFIWML